MERRGIKILGGEKPIDKAGLQELDAKKDEQVGLLPELYAAQLRDANDPHEEAFVRSARQT